MRRGGGGERESSERAHSNGAHRTHAHKCARKKSVSLSSHIEQYAPRIAASGGGVTYPTWVE